MLSKLPAFQFYTGDWLKDPKLSMCDPGTRGIWMDLISAMHESDRSGILRGTAEQLARTARCSAKQFVAAAEDLRATDAACVTLCPDNVTPTYTIINRRMRREFEDRKHASDRKKRQRGQPVSDEVTGIECECHGAVQQKSRSPSSSSSSSSSSNTKNITPLTPQGVDERFERFWKEYPNKTGKKAAKKSWDKIKGQADVLEKIIHALLWQIRSEQWTKDGGQFIPNPATYLNQGRWEDEPVAEFAPKDRSLAEENLIDIRGKLDEIMARRANEPRAVR